MVNNGYTVVELSSPSLLYILLFAIVLAILFTIFTPTMPIDIKKLDIDSFFKGCIMARDGVKPDIKSFNPHSMLGYKISLLFKSDVFLRESPGTDEYILLKIGSADDNIVFIFRDKTIDIPLIQDFITDACCTVRLTKVNKDTIKNTDLVVNLFK